MSRETLWVWKPYSTERGRAFVTEFRGLADAGIDRLLKGERFSRLPRVVASGLEPGRFVDNLGAYVGVHLVTEVLADVLKKLAQDHVQLLPVSIEGHVELKYFAVNVLESLPLLDRDRSRFETFAGTDVISRVSRLALRPVPPGAPPIFHLAEHPVVILVNDEMRRALEAASRYPGRLTPASKWRNEY